MIKQYNFLLAEVPGVARCILKHFEKNLKYGKKRFLKLKSILNFLSMLPQLYSWVLFAGLAQRGYSTEGQDVR